MRVLIVEDDLGVREGLAEFLADLVEVEVAATLAEAEQWLAKESFDLVLTDLRLGSSAEAGLRVMKDARKNGAQVAILTATTPGELADAFKEGRPDAVLTKPFSLDELEGLLAQCQARALG